MLSNDPENALALLIYPPLWFTKECDKFQLRSVRFERYGGRQETWFSRPLSDFSHFASTLFMRS